jgi:hypothetical protein
MKIQWQVTSKPGTHAGFLGADAEFPCSGAGHWALQEGRPAPKCQKGVRVEASREDAESLRLALRGGIAPIVPALWSFGQLARLVGAPACYLRQLPAQLAGQCGAPSVISVRSSLPPDDLECCVASNSSEMARPDPKVDGS